MFGDMGNTLGLMNIVVKVDMCNVFMTEKDVIETVGGRRTQSDMVASKGCAKLELFTTEGDFSFSLDLTDDIGGAILYAG